MVCSYGKNALQSNEEDMALKKIALGEQVQLLHRRRECKSNLEILNWLGCILSNILSVIMILLLSLVINKYTVARRDVDYVGMLGRRSSI